MRFQFIIFITILSVAMSCGGGQAYQQPTDPRMEGGIVPLVFIQGDYVIPLDDYIASDFLRDNECTHDWVCGAYFIGLNENEKLMARAGHNYIHSLSAPPPSTDTTYVTYYSIGTARDNGTSKLVKDQAEGFVYLRFDASNASLESDHSEDLQIDATVSRYEFAGKFEYDNFNMSGVTEGYLDENKLNGALVSQSGNVGAGYLIGGNVVAD